MTKVLGIVGSPRKNGNTDILVNRILQGAEDAGASTERVFLADLDIAPCDACEICFKGKPCKEDDDMQGLYAQFMEADTIVFGTPVYWWGPTAYMKTFVDRLYFFAAPENMKKVKGKGAVLATVFEDRDVDVASGLVFMFDESFKYLALKPAGRLVVPGVGEKGAINRKEDVLMQAAELGASLAREK